MDSLLAAGIAPGNDTIIAGTGPEFTLPLGTIPHSNDELLRGLGAVAPFGISTRNEESRSISTQL